MNPLTALDFCIKHKVVADQIIADCDDTDLAELAFELLRLFAHATRQLHTELGRLTITSALHDIAKADDEDWPARHAAELILTHSMANDVCIETALRELGVYGMQQRWHVINVTADVPAVIAAIPALWFRLLPALDTPLLEHFAGQLNEDFS